MDIPVGFWVRRRVRALIASKAAHAGQMHFMKTLATNSREREKYLAVGAALSFVDTVGALAVKGLYRAADPFSLLEDS